MQSFYGVSGTKCYLSLEVKFDYLEFHLSDIFPQRPTNSKRPPKEMPFDIWFKIIIIGSSPLKDKVLTLYWAGLLSNKQPPKSQQLATDIHFCIITSCTGSCGLTVSVCLCSMCLLIWGSGLEGQPLWRTCPSLRPRRRARRSSPNKQLCGKLLLRSDTTTSLACWSKPTSMEQGSTLLPCGREQWIFLNIHVICCISTLHTLWKYHLMLLPPDVHELFWSEYNLIVFVIWLQSRLWGLECWVQSGTVAFPEVFSWTLLVFPKLVICQIPTILFFFF